LAPKIDEAIAYHSEPWLLLLLCILGLLPRLCGCQTKVHNLDTA